MGQACRIGRRSAKSVSAFCVSIPRICASPPGWPGPCISVIHLLGCWRGSECCVNSASVIGRRSIPLSCVPALRCLAGWCRALNKCVRTTSRSRINDLYVRRCWNTWNVLIGYGANSLAARRRYCCRFAGSCRRVWLRLQPNLAASRASLPRSSQRQLHCYRPSNRSITKKTRTNGCAPCRSRLDLYVPGGCVRMPPTRVPCAWPEPWRG